VAESALPAKELHQPEEHGGRHSAVPYFVVWIALLGFTALTYFTGTAHLGPWALAIALCIAVIKSGMVALVFMHLKDSSGATRLVFATSLVFMALLLFFTVADVATRFRLATPAGSPFGTERSQPAGLLEHELPEEE